MARANTLNYGCFYFVGNTNQSCTMKTFKMRSFDNDFIFCLEN